MLAGGFHFFFAGDTGTVVDDPLAPNAPVISWTSAPDVDPPTIEAIIDNTVSEGDTYERQIDVNAGFTSPTTISTTVSASDIGSLEVVWGDDEAAMDAFGAGTWYVRDRVGPSDHLSAWSNTISETLTEAFMKVALEGGLIYPGHWATRAIPALQAGGTVDLATEKVAFIGRVYWGGRPGSTKTISAAGGGSISFTAGAVTFADGATTLELGIQDVSAVANQPDGTFDVSRVLTGGVDAINANAGNTFAMTGGSGSKSIAHGDLIAIVFDMTARAGSDSVIINALLPGGGNLLNGTGIPGLNTFTSSAWGVSYTRLPNVVLTADDGTIGTLDGAGIFASIGTETVADNVSPDERGFKFQTNFDCDVDGILAYIRPDGNFTARLYGDPSGTPTQLAEVAQVAEVFGAGGDFRIGFFTFATPVSLTANTDYCLAVKSTENSAFRFVTNTLFDEAHRALLLGGTTVAKATRDGETGAFTAESPAVTLYAGLALRISHIHTPT